MGDGIIFPGQCQSKGKKGKKKSIKFDSASWVEADFIDADIFYNRDNVNLTSKPR